MIVFVVVFSLLFGIPTAQEFMPCVAFEYLDDLFDEQWDFRIPYWENNSISLVTQAYNIPPMQGNYTYVYNFCNDLNLYMGDYMNNKSVFGWSYGYMASFYAYDVFPDYPTDEYNSTAFLEFSMQYVSGDSGSPCTTPRSAWVNIYCGFDFANCSTIPGSNGTHCLDSPSTLYPKPGFCLCGIVFNDSSICNGLELNLLSNRCPRGVAIPLNPPIAPYYPLADNARSVGIAIAVIAVIFLVSMIAGFVYNITVQSKKGCNAIPFYDSCTGKKEQVIYENKSQQTPPPTPAVLTPVQSPPTASSYGSI